MRALLRFGQLATMLFRPFALRDRQRRVAEANDDLDFALGPQHAGID